ncbi:MAG: MTAP family purine nucleoside phosphorylase [Elusimicrobiota bacterium]|jgi:5'-methylthioadenosine phosphorylase|nr:MTAP family purine nucleoside phosphorylase [Elusimicrobiota bacterium]
MIDIAIIGGSGLYKIDGMKDVKEIAVNTPFGAPSDKIITGTLSGVKIGFLARHNRAHLFTPTEVPYRANVYALKKLGARIVLSFSACGSLRENMPPKSFCFPDQIVDKTTLRPNTFFGNGVVDHFPFGHPISISVQKAFAQEAKKLKLKHKLTGTVVAMEGPLFSTKAESLWHRKMGWDLIGMTSCPESKLIREAGMAFGFCAMITDYDSWRDNTEDVSHDMVKEVMKYNEVAAKKLLAAALPKIAALKNAGERKASIYKDMLAKNQNKTQVKKLKVIFD